MILVTMSTTTSPSVTEASESPTRPNDGIVYVSGRFQPAGEASVSVFDHGLLYGDGIFEGIRAYNGRVFEARKLCHIERLFDSAKAIRLEVPHSQAAICDIVVETCRRNEITDGYIRLLITRGPGDLGIDPRKCRRPEVIVIARKMMNMYGDAGSAKRLVTSSFRRNSPDTTSPSIKSLNYLNNVLAKIEANDRGADEALMLDVHGFVSEASVDNLFIVADHGLVTPPAATNLKGVTRETVIELSAGLGIPVTERALTLFDVWTAHEVFICGTGAEIIPVGSVDGRTIGDGGVGAMTRRISDAYHDRVRSEGRPIFAK